MFRLKLFYVFLLSAVFIVLVFSACNNSSNEKVEMTRAEKVARGEFLITFGGCGDCHTPKVFTPNGPVPDTSKILSGCPSNTTIANVDSDLV